MKEGEAMKILIVGGGIGGLAAAIALQQKGLRDVAVFERASDWKRIQVGSGLEMQSNAMRALHELGVEDRVIEVGTVVDKVLIVSPRGTYLGEFAHGEVARRYGFPDVRMTRGELHRILADAVGENIVRLGERVTGFIQDEGGVTVSFEDGREERGDVLIAADGINSVIREQLHGASEPIYQGYPWWRGIYDAPHPAFPLGTPSMVMGPGGCFAGYPVGDKQVSWFCCAKAPLGDTVSKAQLVERFGSWSTPIREVLEGTDESTITRTDLMDRDPLTWWGEGRVTLLGDAAHPMVPTITQGAAQALEDAVVLARCLAADPDPVAALRQYESLRIPRTTEVVERARSTGRLLVQDNPMICWLRERYLALGGHRIVKRQFLQQMSVEV
jgi:2-polyprenyl-6-methoxyphenol hydroxylase-like FAD-dependent oxidoreductase